MQTATGAVLICLHNFVGRMAASTNLTATDVARILNRYGASARDVVEDVSDVIADYFDDRHHAAVDADSNPDADDSEDTDEVAESTAMDFETSQQEVSDDVPIIRIQYDYQPDSEHVVGDKLNSLFAKGCGCARNCVKKFPQDLIQQSALDCMDNDFYCNQHVSHQHLLLLGAMNSLVHNQPETIQKDHKSQSRVESRSTYMFRGIEVCRNFFSVVFGCGEKRLKNVKKQFLSEGISPKQHGNIHKTSSHANFEKRVTARTFIQNFAENHALVLPGRLPNYKNPDLKLLPSSYTKKHVYSLYESALRNAGQEPLSLCLFYQVWSDFCQNIVIQLPRSDLCALCQQNQMSVAKMRNLPEDEKIALIQKCQEHLLLVQKEREHYNSVIGICKSQPNCPKDVGLHSPCSFPGKMHISFDFAQQIHLPYDSQQVGPIYFLTGYKVALFGVAIEPLAKFVLYIIPEACATGKGSNIVLSLLHHFFSTFGVGETDVICHADNCCGQNKNNFMMQYACWRTCVALHNTFAITFLPVGHTKFWPDLYFGLFKKKLRSYKAETISDVCRIARDACPVTNAIIPIAVGDESGHVTIPTYDWQGKFNACMKAIPDLKQYHYFEFSGKGTVFCKRAVTDPNDDGVTVGILKTVTHSTSLPDVVPPQNFPIERRKYLAEKIRPFVTSESAKDILCPIPTEHESDPTPETSTESVGAAVACEDEADETVEVKGRKRKPPACGYCKQTGHRNQVRNGVPLCPKRKADFEQGQVP